MSESSERRRAQYTMPYASSQKALPPPVRNARQCHLCAPGARQRQPIRTINSQTQSLKDSPPSLATGRGQPQIHRARITAEIEGAKWTWGASTRGTHAPVVLSTKYEISEQDGNRRRGQRYDRGGQCEEAEGIVRARRE